MPYENFNLNELATRQNVKLSVATAEDELEKATRLRIEEANALHARQKEWLVYRLTALILLIAVSLCSWLILSKGLATDEGKLALGLLTSIVTGLVGYVTGKASNDNKAK
jgi:hypothetical protein